MTNISIINYYNILLITCHDYLQFLKTVVCYGVIMLLLTPIIVNYYCYYHKFYKLVS